MAGPDQPNRDDQQEPRRYTPEEQQYARPDQLGADRRDEPSSDDVATTQVSREAWSRQIPEQDAPSSTSAATTAYPAVGSSATGDAPTPRTADEQPAVDATGVRTADDRTDAATSTRAYRPVDEDDPIDAPRTTSAGARTAEPTASADPAPTQAHDPFRSGPQAAAPSAAPFPTGSSSSGEATTVLPAGGVRRDDSQQAYADAPDRTAAYPGTPQSTRPAQPAYVPPGGGDERNTFLGQQSRDDEVVLAPARSRIWQNLAGALAGLVLVFGPIIGFALLAGTPDSLFDAETGRKILVLGMIAVAAVPALLAGWAPAAAWLPGVILLVLGGIAYFSEPFARTLGRWSSDLFSTPVVGQFVVAIGPILGFALVFAGLGTAWSRASGRDSVVNRIQPPRSTTV